MNLLAGIAVVTTASALAFADGNQYRIGSDSAPGLRYPGHGHGPRCDLSRPVDPSGDGLLTSEKLFSGSEALKTLVKHHQSLVKIPSICYDDLGDFDQDERWKPFYDIPIALKDAYPNIHKYATIETVNRFGLVYTVQGSDENLAPILLTAHQDVVPVEEETLDRWEHPPFDAYYDSKEEYLYGRGASDDKSAITALMSAMEGLLSQDDYDPRRTTIFAFGFDEECSGNRGAAEISKHLEERYGEGGIAVILDEGGAGLQSVGDTLYALPAVYEKGYLDVWFDLDVIVVNLEANPFRPEIIRNSPVHQALVCFAQYSPYAAPELTKAIYWGNLGLAAEILAQASRETQYFIQTSQAVDWIAGGQKINALPEFVTLGVNHRFAPQDSIGSIQHRITHLVGKVARKYNLRVEAFEDDEDYERYLASNGLSRPEESAHHPWQPNYNGTIVLDARKKSYVTPQSPTSGRVWDVFAGTVRNTFARQARTVVVAPGTMTGNTDTRHYLNLSKNIYRWSPGSLKSFSNIHTFNERLLMSEHLNMAKFYYDFIRNFDQAKL